MSELPAPIQQRRSLRQPILIGAVFLCALALLGVGYLLFLRPGYAVLAQGMRPAEANAIVTELQKRGIAYKLRDDGTTILVPEDEADATRVAIAGSEAAAKGQIGFELFNKSDMGLTNFAQKINFQRALQGELVRTIEQLDGVESARVHLALPEKTLFRGDRSEPKAAVTLMMRPGNVADPARVAGIQRLVAAAVPDLPEAQVVVLDSGGRVISASAAAPATDPDRPADLEERSAVEQYYHARARRTIEALRPGLRFQLQVMAMPLDTAPAAESPDSGSQWVPTESGGARNFRLRVALITAVALNPEDAAALREAVTREIALDTARGDSLSLQVGPTDPAPAPALPPVQAAAPVGAPVPAAPIALGDPSRGAGFGFWVSVVLAVLGVAALVLWRLFAGRAPVGTQHQDFAQRLRRQIHLAEDADSAAR